MLEIVAVVVVVFAVVLDRGESPCSRGGAAEGNDMVMVGKIKRGAIGPTDVIVVLPNNK